MVSVKLMLIFTIIWTAAYCSLKKWYSGPVKVQAHPIEVGKTLALHRMRKWGVEGGNWQDYTSIKLGIV